MELNPNNEVTRQMRGQWHKIAALIMRKLNQTKVEITLSEIDEFSAEGLNIVVDERGSSKTNSFKILLVDDATAEKLAREAGGLACDS